MIHQPAHLIGVATNGLLALIGLGFLIVRLKSQRLNSQQRIGRWLLLCMSIGMIFFAADEWCKATEWPPIMTIHWTDWHLVGAFFIGAALIGMVIVTSRMKAEDTENSGPPQS